MKYQQVKSLARRAGILEAAVKIARRPGGWAKMTREAIALEAECSEGLVSHYLGNIITIRRAVVKIAVKDEITEIVVQSLTLHDGFIQKRWLPASLKNKIGL